MENVNFAALGGLVGLIIVTCVAVFLPVILKRQSNVRYIVVNRTFRSETFNGKRFRSILAAKRAVWRKVPIRAQLSWRYEVVPVAKREGEFYTMAEISQPITPKRVPWWVR
ncbi:membrane protein [Microbacterium phage Curie]